MDVESVGGSFEGVNDTKTPMTNGDARNMISDRVKGAVSERGLMAEVGERRMRLGKSRTQRGASERV